MYLFDLFEYGLFFIECECSGECVFNSLCAPSVDIAIQDEEGELV